MKAWVSRKYGSPDVMRLEDMECPIPGETEVLLDVRAISVNPYDWHYLRGSPGVFRFAAGLFRPKNIILGSDVAGTVREIGSKVTDFKVGDEVFGEAVLGGFAEAVCASADRLAFKPKNLSFEQSASLSMAGITALQGLRDTGRIRTGETVLINGASGGVGTYAVQLAKTWNTFVTGVCGTGNMEMVRSLGADAVIDYTQTDVPGNGQRYDLVVDTVGSLSLTAMKALISPGGRAVVIGFSSMRRMMHIGIAGGKTIKAMTAGTTRKDLEYIRDLVESGRIKPVIDRSYPFSDLPKAMDYLEEGHAKGKVVVTV